MLRPAAIRRVIPVLVLTAVATMASACGDTHVGSSDLFKNISDKATPPPAVATATPTAPPTARPTAATRVTPPPVKATPKPTATPRPAPQFAIDIYGDNTGQPQFNPSPVRVYVGTVVVFTNNDNVARSVVADGGAFNSGPIAPGKSWSYTASSAGTFDYHDGTRPYAVGTLQVVSH